VTKRVLILETKLLTDGGEEFVPWHRHGVAMDEQMVGPRSRLTGQWINQVLYWQRPLLVVEKDNPRPDSAGCSSIDHLAAAACPRVAKLYFRPPNMPRAHILN